MNLTDKETLELSELCSALADGALASARRERLSEWLRDSEEARRFYIRYSGLSASLFDYAGELQTERAATSAQAGRVIQFPAFLFRAALAAAAMLVAAVGIRLFMGHETAGTAGEVDTEELVAHLTGTYDCTWRGESPLLAGSHLRQGQDLELEKGVAEITFDSGARIILEGPASFELNSAWEATLRRGALRAIVPPEAIGFRVTHQAVDVVDLGTEFTMLADGGGNADVRVIRGAIQTSAHDGPPSEKTVLRENQSRRFGRAGVAELAAGNPPLARLPRFKRIAMPARVLHWSFDEPEGAVARAEKEGRIVSGFDATMAGEDASPAAFRAGGRVGRALNLDGGHAAQIPFPGISSSTARTFTFWLRVPADARLSESYGAVSWIAAASGRMAARTIQIGWNASPSQGALGALRLDVGHGYSIGTTDLRDDRWHHIAVALVPGERGNGKMHVRSYVDGRLDQSSPRVVKGARHSRAETAPFDAKVDRTDTLWLGRAPGRAGDSGVHFRGALDELFIADRALTPAEIGALMRDNRAPGGELLADGLDPR